MSETNQGKEAYSLLPKQQRPDLSLPFTSLRGKDASYAEAIDTVLKLPEPARIPIQQAEGFSQEAKTLLGKIGAEVYKKERSVKLPVFPLDTEEGNRLLSDYSGLTDTDKLRRQLVPLMEYLTYPAIRDQFENSHEARGKWFNELSDEEKKLFQSVFNDSQFKANKFTVISVRIESLADMYDRAGFEEKAARVKAKGHALYQLIARVGNRLQVHDPYEEMNYPGKVKVVQLYEATIVDILSSVLPPSEKPQEVLLT